jgi:hypothetical protein
MGDRTTWYEKCPQCEEEDGVEVYDAPSCLQWSCMCERCGWTDNKDYYETEPNTIELLHIDEAKKRGLDL